MRRRSSAAAAALGGLAGLVLLGGCGGGSGSLPVPKIGPARPGTTGSAPPAGAVVDARQWGNRDLAVARRGSTTTISVVGPQGNGVGGLTIEVNGRSAVACGSGCYRASADAGPLVVRVDGRRFRFDIPASAPSARGLVATAAKAFAHLESVALEQRIASGPGTAVVTSFLSVAPDRVRYSNRGGSQAIVIGSHRWDRPSSSGRWTRSPQTPVRVMHVPWGRPTNAHVVAPHTVTFFDLATRAWFRVVLDPKSTLPTTVLMTGISHFMVDRFSRFDAPAAITAPRR